MFFPVPSRRLGDRPFLIPLSSSRPDQKACFGRLLLFYVVFELFSVFFPFCAGFFFFFFWFFLCCVAAYHIFFWPAVFLTVMLLLGFCSATLLLFLLFSGVPHCAFLDACPQKCPRLFGPLSRRPTFRLFFFAGHFPSVSAESLSFKRIPVSRSYITCPSLNLFCSDSLFAGFFFFSFFS